jgi:hypothetical protein
VDRDIRKQTEKKGCPDIAASNHFRYQQVGTSRVGADEKGENLG